jgi:hypothetical protein
MTEKLQNAVTTRIVNTITMDGISYSTVSGLSTKFEIGRITIMNLMDEYEVNRFKISRMVFYDTQVAEIILDVFNNKNTYLKEVISNKLSGLNKNEN